MKIFPGEEFVEIDGSHGEGGGQILRSALCLASITGKPMRIDRIRAGRKRAGLQAQHLKAVEAAAAITGARTEGVTLGSQSVTFVPKPCTPGEFQFDIKTAGSVTLLLQAVLPPLALSMGRSRLTLTGGTHVPWSPPFHYFSEVFLPTIERMGVHAEATLHRWGFYPRGGGSLSVEILPTKGLNPVSLVERGALRKIRGLSATAHLPGHVGERQRNHAVKGILEELKVEAEIEVFQDIAAPGPGSLLFLVAEFENGRAGFSSLGRKGKRAEEVAEEAVSSLKKFMATGACIDPHLADQIALFMALARGHSSFTTSRITQHLLTLLWVIPHFIKREVSVRGEEGVQGRVDFINE